MLKRNWCIFLPDFSILIICLKLRDLIFSLFGFVGSGGGAVTGREYLSLMEKHRPVLQWKDNFAEHFFIYSDNHINHAVFYPSLKSISLRLAEARSWGAGISIWEIGQGLDYFFDLLWCHCKFLDNSWMASWLYMFFSVTLFLVDTILV